MLWLITKYSLTAAAVVLVSELARHSGSCTAYGHATSFGLDLL